MRRFRSLAVGTLVLVFAGTLGANGLLAQITKQDGDKFYIILEDEKATLSNNASIDEDTPRTTEEGGREGNFTLLKNGQSLLWRNMGMLPQGMYEVFVVSPEAEKQAVIGRISSYVVGKSGASSRVGFPVDLQKNSSTRTENFDNQEWIYGGDLFVDQGATIYSLVFSTLSEDNTRVTPIDAVLIKTKPDQSRRSVFSFNGGYAEDNGDRAKIDLTDGGRPIIPGEYEILANWDAVPDLSDEEKEDLKSTSPSPYVEFEVFGVESGKNDRAFSFSKSLDLRTPSSGTELNGKTWSNLGTVVVQGSVNAIQLQWTVDNVPGTPHAPGSTVWFPVRLRNTSVPESSSSSSSESAASESTASSSEASSESSSSTSSSVVLTITTSSSTSTSSTTSSSSSQSSSSSSRSAPSIPTSGVLEITQGSAVLDNGSANFYSVGFERMNGNGYRDAYHASNPNDPTAIAVGGAYAGWRLPTLEHGEYDAFLTWPSVQGGAPNAMLRMTTISPSADSFLKITKNIVVNQSRAPSGPTAAGKSWQHIARIKIDEYAGYNSIEFRVKTSAQQGTVFADALLLKKLGN